MLTHMLWERHAADTVYQEAGELAGLPEVSTISSAQTPPMPIAVAKESHSVSRQESIEDSFSYPANSAAVDTEEGAVHADPFSNHGNPYADALQKMDLTPLREVNKEVLGWILIPGVLSYPLMAGEDNHFYLEHTWKGTNSSVGAIFLDCRNSKGLDEFNAIIYGHRMNDRSMFGRLGEYADQDFRDEYPHIYLNSDGNTRIYEVFAAYETPLPSTAYQITFHSDIERQEFLNVCIEKSVIEGACVPTTDSRILTLSTCTGNGHDSRWVVHAVLQRSDGGASG